jgi:hypothetical protein
MTMKEYSSMRVLEQGIDIPADSAVFEGMLSIPLCGTGIVLLAFGGVECLNSPFNRRLAQAIREAGMGTLVMNLLTQVEGRSRQTEHLRFDVGLLAKRLVKATAWLAREAATQGLHPCYFASGTASGAALVAAAELGDKISAVVSCGGWPDLAERALIRVKSPTLLITAGRDELAVELNEQAYAQLQCEKMIELVPGTTDFFDEPVAFDRASQLTVDWFLRHLSGQRLQD